MDLEEQFKQWMTDIRPLTSDHSELLSDIQSPQELEEPAQQYKPSSFGQNVLANAKADLGVTEDLGKNDGKRIREYFKYYNLSAGQDWCAAAVAAWMKEAGGGPIAGAIGVKEIARQFKQIGRFIPKNKITPEIMQAGNIVMWNRGGPDSNQGHIGVIETSDGKSFTSIEGNSGTKSNSVVRNNHSINDGNLLGIGLLSDYVPNVKSPTANYAIELANLFYKKAIY